MGVLWEAKAGRRSGFQVIYSCGWNRVTRTHLTLVMLVINTFNSRWNMYAGQKLDTGLDFPLFISVFETNTQELSLLSVISTFNSSWSLYEGQNLDTGLWAIYTTTETVRDAGQNYLKEELHPKPKLKLFCALSKLVFWSITQELLVLLKFHCHVWVSHTIFCMLLIISLLFFKRVLIILK